MNKKIMMSGMSILSALTLMTGSAFAAFTTSASLTGNTFSTTNPNLQISTNNVDFASTEPGFIVGGLVPGGSTANQTFKLRNANTDPTGALALTVGLTNTGGGLNGADLSITISCGVNTQTHNYNDWVAGTFSLGTLAPGTDVDCTMSGSLAAAAGNADKGQSRQFDAVFNGSIGS